MARIFILTGLLAAMSCSSFAQPCNELLIPTPWVQPVILNAPVVQDGETIGKVASWRMRAVVARPCSWCPKFGSKTEADTWLREHPLGQRTRQAALSLAVLTRKSLATHFYGLAFAAGELYFVSKIPRGKRLKNIVESRPPSGVTSAGEMAVSTAGFINKDHVKSVLRVREVLNLPEARYPFANIEFVEPGGRPGDIGLAAFLGALDWSLEANGKAELSFYNVGNLFDFEGHLRTPLKLRHEADLWTGVNYSHLLMMTLVLMNTNPGEAWLNLLAGKSISFFSVSDFVDAIRVNTSADPLLRKLRYAASDYVFTPYARLVSTYLEGKFKYEGEVMFASDALLQEHFAKHGHEFGANSPEGYLAMATRFMRSLNVAEEVGKDSRNYRIEYRRIRTNPMEYVVVDPDSGITAVITLEGTLKTFFVQTSTVSGMDVEAYFMEQARKNILDIK